MTAERLARGRKHLAEPQEIAGPANGWSRATLEHLTEEQRTTAIGDTTLTVVRQGMRVMVVSISWTKYFKRPFLREMANNGEPAELVRALVPMEDTQTASDIL